MLVLYLGIGAAAASAQTANPDELYRDRQNMASARKAAEIWAGRAAGGHDFEASWKLARICYWIGSEGDPQERRPALERGLAAGEQAITIDSSRPEGHFWLAATMGGLAQSFGVMQGIKYRGRIKKELELVLAMGESWQEGSADRALGWWYHMVPGLFGGSEEKAETYLRKALSYNTESTVTLFFLSEVLKERGKKAESDEMLRRIISAPVDPDWIPEDTSYKRQAAELLAKNAKH